MPAPGSLFVPVGTLILASLLLGIVNRTKAFIAGRRVPPLLQRYWDIAKYLRRGRGLRRGDELLLRWGGRWDCPARHAAFVKLRRDPRAQEAHTAKGSGQIDRQASPDGNDSAMAHSNRTFLVKS
jgi:hypothetical protein